MTRLPQNSVHIVLRAAPSFWEELDKAAKKSGKSVLLCQGQAKTYSGNGATNPSLFAQQDWDDHPGPKPSERLRRAIVKALEQPETTVHIYNSFVGDNANDRARAGEFVLAHINKVYKKNGGTQKIVYHMLYDADGRNDKVHETSYVDENGKTHTQSENNAPGGVYAPIIYHAVGADIITVFDPHSKRHFENLAEPFGRENVHVISNLERISEEIIKKHRNSILSGVFRIGAPDGWDKKDNIEHNLAIERVKTVLSYIWDKMGDDIQSRHENFDAFCEHSMFGVIKKRESAYQGAPAQPVVKGVFGNIEGCDCVLLDDVADSGSSLTKSSEALLSKGAVSVDAAICHGPAEEKSLHNILNATCLIDGRTRVSIDTLITSNTMARVEGFIEKLSTEQKRRVTLINCGEAMVSALSHIFGNKMETTPRMQSTESLTQRFG